MSEFLLLGAGSARSGRVWTPASQQNLELWLRPEDLPAVGELVTTWVDASGKGHDFTQAVTASKPVVVAGIGGHPAAQMDGIDDTLAVAAGFAIHDDGSSDFSVAGVLRYNDANRWFGTWQGDGNSYWDDGLWANSIAARCDPVAQQAIAVWTRDTDWHLFEFYYSGTTGLFTVYLDGADVTNAHTSFAAMASPVGISNLGRPGLLTASVDYAELFVVKNAQADHENVVEHFGSRYPSLGLS